MKFDITMTGLLSSLYLSFSALCCNIHGVNTTKNLLHTVIMLSLILQILESNR